MTPTFENAIEIIRQLPPPEREKVRDWIDEENQKSSTKKEIEKADLERKNEKFKRALQWVEENKEEYDGKFVLLEGDNLIAHGTNPKELYETARNKGIKIPFVKRVKAKELPFGGW
ncbi:MAG: DUF5678 domain-containing protein [Pyrinomonadaceae bacterium]